MKSSLKNWKKKKNWNDLQTKGGRPINLNSTNLEEVVVLLWDCNVSPIIWHFLYILNLCPKNLKIAKVFLQCITFLVRKLVSNCLTLTRLETNKARLLFHVAHNIITCKGQCPHFSSLPNACDAPSPFTVCWCQFTDAHFANTSLLVLVCCC